MLTETTTRPRSMVATAVGMLAVLYAITFLLGALLHLGVRIPLGFAVLAEPRIIPATIVEGLCGLGLAVGAYAVLTGRSWAHATAWRRRISPSRRAGCSGEALPNAVSGQQEEPAYRRRSSRRLSQRT
jgi:hypothetical protein